ncbi:MAG: hypothetical protein H6Q72_2840 [Firmicutes bacterium]|nr:hypothetical protein [Bacillota bacterium]
MKLPTIVVGGGGHAKVLIDILQLTTEQLLGFTDIRSDNKMVLGVLRMGDDTIISSYSPNEIQLVNGIGSVGCADLRRQLFEKFKQRGFAFKTLQHPRAIISREIVLGEGAQIMAGAVIQPGCIIGSNTIINTRAAIDHDCSLENHVHIAPGAVLSGGVHIGEGAHIGAGATIIQGVNVGRNSIVGAGAVVTRDVPSGVTVVGIPAKEA